MTQRRLPEIAAALALGCGLWGFAGVSSANDSSGFLGTTGIVELSKTDAVVMQSERLEIGLDRVRIDYVFKNVSAAPVDTVVAFPLPDLDMAPGPTSSNFNFPVRDDNFLGFTVSVDGQPVAVSLERRGFLGGREVTKELYEAGLLSLGPWRNGPDEERIKRIPAATLERLQKAGLLGPGEDSDLDPKWTLRTKYYWRQSFPAGREVKVHHEYKPFVGTALVGKPSDVNGKSYFGRYLGAVGAVSDRYCIDDSTRRALVKADKAVKSPWAGYVVSEIEYVLTTANNWRGPIGRFTLVLDKGAPDNILSLCFDGALKKTGPTSFEGTLADFRPKRDLNLLILVRQQVPN